MEEKASKLWKKIQKICEASVNDNEFNMFFKNVEASEFSDNTLTLVCKNQLVKAGIEKYKKKIEDSGEILNDESIDVIFELLKVAEPIYSETYRIQEYKNKIKTGLNPKNRLDNFVIGDNSKLAFEACVAVVNSVSERDEPAYNPLFIYGSSGLGKTHLMQGVGNAILERRPYYI